MKRLSIRLSGEAVPSNSWKGVIAGVYHNDRHERG